MKGEKKKAKSETGEKENKLASYLNIYKVNSLDAKTKIMVNYQQQKQNIKNFLIKIEKQ